jgi:hypothetical protein
MHCHNFPKSVQTRLLSSILLFAPLVGLDHTLYAQSLTTGLQPKPVYQEPRHHLVFQNSVVRVLDVLIPAGDTTAFHVHANPLVGVALEDARSWAQVLGSPPDSVEAAGPVPFILDNWNRMLPYTHRVANVDSVPIHYFVAEWLASPGIEAKLLPEDGMRHLVKEGQIARVYRVTIPAHAATTIHEHSAPGLTVLGSAGVLVDEGAQPAAVGGRGAGQWSWRTSGHRHVLRNTGDRPLTVFEIDWR